MTPAIDIAKKRRIVYQLHSYEHNPSAMSYGAEAAESLNVDAERVFKTLVVETNTGELVVGILPVTHTLNLKAIAKAVKAKKTSMADKQKVQRVTGYVLGGVSPLGQKKSLTSVIDSSAESFETIFVSAGQRGLEIELNPYDLRNIVEAQFFAIAT